VYKLNDIDLSNYGIIAGQVPNSNIALIGHWDLPARIGDTSYSWAEEDSIQPYVDADEIFFGGRTISFHATIFGTRDTINTNLFNFYQKVRAYTDLVVFSTPYGDYSVYVKDLNTVYHNGACSIIMELHEPVVDLTGGTTPATGSDRNTIDRIPFSSFGLYLSSVNDMYDLPELKEQFFTKYGAEGYQIVKRKNNILKMKSVLIASSLVDLQTKIKNLYLLFSSSGMTKIKFNTVFVDCFAVSGFTVSRIHCTNTSYVAEFNIDLTSTNVYMSVYITENSGNKILTTEDGKILIYG
jgi:hypothetical protein